MHRVRVDREALIGGMLHPRPAHRHRELVLFDFAVQRVQRFVQRHELRQDTHRLRLPRNRQREGGDVRRPEAVRERRFAGGVVCVAVFRPDLLPPDRDPVTPFRVVAVAVVVVLTHEDPFA